MTTTPCKNRCCPTIEKSEDGDWLVLKDDFGGKIKINFLQLERLWQEAQELSK